MGIPVSVIGGYLGAGKTTLVNHLLRNANGRKLAVLVNEFGELPIDADLIEADDGDMISIAGGCICCSYGSDLVGALMELPERMPNMDGMLIEASGVALPGVQSGSVLAFLNPWISFMDIILGCYPWILSMDIIQGYYPWV